MRTRRFRAPRWATLILTAAALLTAVGAAGFGYVSLDGGWNSYFGPVTANHYIAPPPHSHLTVAPYYQACNGAHCGHLAAPGSLLGLYDCLALPCGPNLTPQVPYVGYGYAPYNCYFAPCAPPTVNVTDSSRAYVNVDVDNNAKVYGGDGSSSGIKQSNNVTVDVY